MPNELDTFNGLRAYGDEARAILVGGKLWQLLPDEILDFCWNGGLDTPCSICDEAFDIAIAPPVRTVRLYRTRASESNFDRELSSLEILNTHLECMRKNQVQFLPISHAWHTPVGDAYASRVTNRGAAKLVYEQPMNILRSLARTGRFNVAIQIWHDYISIPQWQDRFRGTSVLPQIFKVFQLGRTALLHMDQELDLCALEDRHPEELAKLFGARWFTRLWPVVELNMCEDAFIMNCAYEISRYRLRDLIQKSTCSTSPEQAMIPPWVLSSISTSCLGHVFNVIATQGSRWYRDRFIAACAILEPDAYPSLLPQLPVKTAEACLWLSKRCLERGDFSPLLLRPPSGEVAYDKGNGVNVGWLRGHSKMEPGMWSLGPQTCQSTAVLKIHGDAVELLLPLAGRVRRSLNHVVVSCQYCNNGLEASTELWHEPGDGAQLYSIPQLAYRDSGAASIGVVIEDGRVIGRSRFAHHSCQYETSVKLHLS